DEPALRARRLTIQTLLPLLHLQQLRRHAATAALLLGWRRLHLWLQAVPGGQPLLDMLLSYVAAVSTDSTRNLQDAYAHMSKSIEERYLTTADQLIREGIGRGRLETLLRQLEIRFGPLPPAVAEHVRAGSSEQLELWTERILTA